VPLDFRYHLVSLVAVFCALLIGILLGISLVGDPDLEKQVSGYLTLLQQQRGEIDQLQTVGRAYQTFGREVLPGLIRNKLAGRRIALIVTHRFQSRAPIVEQMGPLLVAAGARVTSTTTVLPGFLHFTAEEAAPLLEELGYPMPVDRNVRSLLAAKMAVHVANGKPELVQRLRSRRLIDVSGDYETPADAVVLVGGQPEADPAAVEAVELPMIRALQEEGVPAVGCEPANVPVSCMEYYQPRHLPTVDNADTVPGQLALVLALAGQEGNYGIKPTADHLLPPRSQW